MLSFSTPLSLICKRLTLWSQTHRRDARGFLGENGEISRIQALRHLQGKLHSGQFRRLREQEVLHSMLD
jgi:hypothetical protein